MTYFQALKYLSRAIEKSFLTQERFCKIFDFSRSSLNKHLNDVHKMSLKQFFNYCDAVGIDIQLIERKDTKGG